MISMSNQTALILEGGGLRGIYTAGVLDCFLENGIDLRDVYAVSAGACHACSYLAYQHGRAYSTNIDYLHDKHYCSIYSLLTTGDLFGANFLYHELPEKLYPIDNEAFLHTPSEFHAVVTNCLTGRVEYPIVRDLFRDVDYVRASSSLPGVSRFVMLNGVPYLDGGISDAIPLRRSESDGHTKNVLVLTRDRSYRKETSAVTPFLKIKYRAYPALIELLEMRHLAYNAQLDYIREAEAAGRAFVIAPTVPLKLGRMEKNREKLNEIYLLGQNDALKKLDELKQYLIIKKDARS